MEYLPQLTPNEVMLGLGVLVGLIFLLVAFQGALRKVTDKLEDPERLKRLADNGYWRENSSWEEIRRALDDEYWWHQENDSHP